jgi:hypothetical protein
MVKWTSRIVDAASGLHMCGWHSITWQRIFAQSWFR